jgi:RNA polymerase sigma factor (sigma-70 family)
MTGDFPATRWSLVGAADGAGLLLVLYAEPIARYLAMKLPEAVRDGSIDDLVQETLVWLAEHPDLLRQAQPGANPDGRPSRFRWYVMTLALNQARNAWRRLRDGAHQTLSGAEVAAEPDRDMDRAWAAAVLADAWRDLAGWAAQGACEADLPEAVRLHLCEGLGVRDIAGRLGLSLGACHRRIASGRALLRRAIVDRLRAAGEAGTDEQAACDALLG